MCTVLIVEYSMYGHIYRMAGAVAEGVSQVEGCEAVISGYRKPCRRKCWE